MTDDGLDIPPDDLQIAELTHLWDRLCMLRYAADVAAVRNSGRAWAGSAAGTIDVRGLTYGDAHRLAVRWREEISAREAGRMADLRIGLDLLHMSHPRPEYPGDPALRAVLASLRDRTHRRT